MGAWQAQRLTGRRAGGRTRTRSGRRGQQAAGEAGGAKLGDERDCVVASDTAHRHALTWVNRLLGDHFVSPDMIPPLPPTCAGDAVTARRGTAIEIADHMSTANSDGAAGWRGGLGGGSAPPCRRHTRVTRQPRSGDGICDCRTRRVPRSARRQQAVDARRYRIRGARLRAVCQLAAPHEIADRH